MIAHFTPEDEFDLGRTTGCSCCSTTIESKRMVLEEVRDNIRVVKQVSEFYKIPLTKLMKDVLTEEKCKKHKPYLKYEFNNEENWYCRKCDKFLERKEKGARPNES